MTPCRPTPTSGACSNRCRRREGNLQDQYGDVEALSGWSLDDVLKGDDAVPATDIDPGVPVGSNVLTARGIGLVDGLRGLLPAGSTSFGGGNILLGGAGSDRLEGRGGDDVIDGDRWLDVRLSVRTNPSDPTTETQSFAGLAALRDAVFAGTVDPGNVVAVREIIAPPNVANDVDTATFSDVRSRYTVTTNGAVTTVTHHPVPLPGGEPPKSDGTDTLRGIERLMFADAIVPVAPGDFVVTTSAGDRTATISWSGPAADAATRFEVHWDDPVSGQAKVRDVGTAHTSSRSAHSSNGRIYQLPGLGLPRQPTAPRWLVPSAPVVPAAVPARPTIGTATGRNGAALVRWSPPVDDGGADVTHYLVRAQDSAGNPVGEPTSVRAPSHQHGGRGARQRNPVPIPGLGRQRRGCRTQLRALQRRSGGNRPGPTGGRHRGGRRHQGRDDHGHGGLVSTVLQRRSEDHELCRHCSPGWLPTASGARVLGRVSSPPLASGARSHEFGLVPGVYRFRVVAHNARGDSPPSARSNAVRAR